MTVLDSTTGSEVPVCNPVMLIVYISELLFPFLRHFSRLQYQLNVMPRNPVRKCWEKLHTRADDTRGLIVALKTRARDTQLEKSCWPTTLDAVNSLPSKWTALLLLTQKSKSKSYDEITVDGTDQSLGFTNLPRFTPPPFKRATWPVQFARRTVPS